MSPGASSPELALGTELFAPTRYVAKSTSHAYRRIQASILCELISCATGILIRLLLRDVAVVQLCFGSRYDETIVAAGSRCRCRYNLALVFVLVDSRCG